MTSGTEAAAKDVAGYLARRREDVDRALERLLPGTDVWPEHLHRAIRHSVFAGGKRLRPILCLTAGEVLGARTEDLIEAACGLEMIHTYSLIHDDLPALDNDDLRRGVPTCHVVFGEATAILAGDALLTHGLGVFAAYPKGERFAAAKVRVLETVVEAIGTQGMIGGQAADLEAEKETAPTAELVVEDPREQDRPPDPCLALGRGDPRRRRRGDPRAHRPLRQEDRPRVPDQGRPARRRVGRGDPRQGGRTRTRPRERRRSRGSGGSSGRSRSWPRTSRTPSRRPRPCRAAGGCCRSWRVSSGIGSREPCHRLPDRLVPHGGILFTSGRGLPRRRAHRSVTRTVLCSEARGAGLDRQREGGAPLRLRPRGLALSER